MDERPASLTLALRLLAALVVLGAVAVVLIVTRQDDLIRSWAEGNPAVREVLNTRGLEAVKEGSVQPPRFVPVAITLYVVLAGLTAVLGVFLNNGYEWARLGITVLLFFSAVAGIAGLRVGQPVVFDVCTVVGLALFAAMMVPLWHPDTTAYIHADPEAEPLRPTA
ncbi:hypothetical protein GCM10009798_21560 [Nocardioides panacihumi]|uniref:Uncharacterized protein n=1 Tax=Nocardioides panacihumi TaxID=400774 RepID=A0ABN2R0X0_9ACTN